MSTAKQTVTIEMPAEVYSNVQDQATRTHRSIEALILDGLQELYDVDTQVNRLHERLKLLDSFSNQVLWAIVEQDLSPEQDRRMRDLILTSKKRRLSADENAELQSLLDQQDVFVMLRAKALAALKARGQDIDAWLKRDQ